jgi:hypothetical protein
MAQRAGALACRAARAPGRLLARPAATLAVMLLAVLATGLWAAGGAGDRDGFVLVAEVPVR